MDELLRNIDWQDAGVATAIVTAAVLAIRFEIKKQAGILRKALARFIKQNSAEHAITLRTIESLRSDLGLRPSPGTSGVVPSGAHSATADNPPQQSSS